MIIGVPKEIKNKEFRVSMTPAGVKKLHDQGHQVLVEENAGIGSGFSNEEYVNAGADLFPEPMSIWKNAEMIVKVKEPVENELFHVQPEQILFTYLHLAASKELTDSLVESGAVCIAYETVESEDGSLPLLHPMSIIAGRLSGQIGFNYLLKQNGGKGKLAMGLPGAEDSHVTVIGAGSVGAEAARIALGHGAKVSLLDINESRLNSLKSELGGKLETKISNTETIADCVTNSDVVVGAVLIPGGKAPILVSKDLVSSMQDGSVVIDVAVDQGGCIETSKVTTHDSPVFTEEGVIHYGVANMPGSVPITSTGALTHVTFPFVEAIANKGWAHAISDDPSLQKGLNIERGKIVYDAVKNAFN